MKKIRLLIFFICLFFVGVSSYVLAADDDEEENYVIAYAECAYKLSDKDSFNFTDDSTVDNIAIVYNDESLITFAISNIKVKYYAPNVFNGDDDFYLNDLLFVKEYDNENTQAKDSFKFRVADDNAGSESTLKQNIDADNKDCFRYKNGVYQPCKFRSALSSMINHFQSNKSCPKYFYTQKGNIPKTDSGKYLFTSSEKDIADNCGGKNWKKNNKCKIFGELQEEIVKGYYINDAYKWLFTDAGNSRKANLYFNEDGFLVCEMDDNGDTSNGAFDVAMTIETPYPNNFGGKTQPRFTQDIDYDEALWNYNNVGSNKLVHYNFANIRALFLDDDNAFPDLFVRFNHSTNRALLVSKKGLNSYEFDNALGGSETALNKIQDDGYSISFTDSNYTVEEIKGCSDDLTQYKPSVKVNEGYTITKPLLGEEHTKTTEYTVPICYRKIEVTGFENSGKPIYDTSDCKHIVDYEEGTDRPIYGDMFEPNFSKCSQIKIAGVSIGDISSWIRDKTPFKIDLTSPISFDYSKCYYKDPEDGKNYLLEEIFKPDDDVTTYRDASFQADYENEQQYFEKGYNLIESIVGSPEEVTFAKLRDVTDEELNTAYLKAYELLVNINIYDHIKEMEDVIHDTYDIKLGTYMHQWEIYYIALMHAQKSAEGYAGLCFENLSKIKEIVEEITESANEYVDRLNILSVAMEIMGEELRNNRGKDINLDENATAIKEYTEQLRDYLTYVRENEDYLFGFSVRYNFDTKCNIISNDLHDWLISALSFIRIGSVIITLILGILDFIKGITSGDADIMKKVWTNFSKRLVALLLLFLLPVILEFILNMFSGHIVGIIPDNPLCNIK